MRHRCSAASRWSQVIVDAGTIYLSAVAAKSKLGVVMAVATAVSRITAEFGTADPASTYLPMESGEAAFVIAALTNVADNRQSGRGSAQEGKVYMSLNGVDFAVDNTYYPALYVEGCAQEPIFGFVWNGRWIHYGPSGPRNINPLAEKGSALSERIATLLSRDGDSKVVLLHGSPGTGKTTAIHTAVAHVTDRVLSVSTSVVSKDPDNAIRFVERTCPDVVIFDDIDRCKDSSAMLEVIDRIRDSVVRGILLSANNLERLDCALLRPGRMDMIEHCVIAESLIEERLLRHASEHAKNRLAGLPVAYASEYDKLHRTVGRDAAEAAVDGLADTAVLVKEMASRPVRENNG